MTRRHGHQETQGPGPRPEACSGPGRRSRARRRPTTPSAAPGLPASLLLGGHGARRVPAAHAHGRGRALRTGRAHQGAGHHAADPGAQAGARARNAGKYEIIAGERRFRAARLAGLDSVPVLVRDVPDEAAAAMSLIENIQREDLNPLEEAQGLQRLVKEFGLTHEQAAQAVGRSRSARQQPAAPVEPGRSGADHADGRRPRHGPCARAAGAGARLADHGRQPDRREEAVGARGRKPGEEDSAPSSTWSRPSRSRRSRATCAAWKRNCRTCSRPKSRCA